MFDDYPQPRWWTLYLVLPLSVGLIWLAQRAAPEGIGRSLLEVGVLAIAAGYVEVWHLLNTSTLLHHPLTDGSTPIYYAREVLPAADRLAPGREIRAAFITDAYNDLFFAPTRVQETAAEPASGGAGE